MKHKINQNMIEQFIVHLVEEEKSNATIEKYRRDIMKFYDFASVNPVVEKTVALSFKRSLLKSYQISSINSIISAVNNFFDYYGWTDCKIKGMKSQRQVFCPEERELTKQEYIRLLQAAKRKKDDRLYYIMQTICSTGIRISELSSITCEAVRKGQAVVRCKNKTRIVLIPGKICSLLSVYIKERNLKNGTVFQTKNHRAVSRSYVWAEMKKICSNAQVSSQKVFPHNLRHLFARCFYEKEKDIIRLADILGHSNINTTRIYTVSTGREHAERMDRLGLVLIM